MDGAKLLKSKPPVSSNAERDINVSTKPLSEKSPVQVTTIVHQPKQPISFEKNILLPQLPSLFETIGYAYFFGAFLTGPQFSFHLYKKFLTVSLYPDINNIPPGSYKSALKSLVLGALYLGAYQIGAGYFPTSYLITKEYAARPFIERLAIMWCAGKFSFTKYLGTWTLVEGACILSGISFNGYDESGNAEWNGLANVDKIIGSFNTNTNLWTKTYIFKRLIFLGNKNLSSVISLVFLALWHGLHSGYYMCFGLEFIDMEAEKRWTKRLENYTKPLYFPQHKRNTSIRFMRSLHQLACWFGQTCALHYAMISFDLLRLEHWITAYNSVYWIGHIVVFSLLFLDLILPRPKAMLMNGTTKINGAIKVNGNLAESKKEQ
ncbi:14894_t:CDS:2 [Acaulospora colombiana]|uniref:14894_t:CDS:1 n=1 Tax=Acaulospora colombiana TaxID=27376 RepID=A0ACA9KUE8_9GLOM|nr:14894_t:CDS:2 [Acaulospora colombiana]